MELTNLKLSTLIFFCVYFFISGADGYIILPTAWYYIRSLGLSKNFYSAVLAAQSLGFILMSPIVGKLADKTRRVKLILFMSVLVKAISKLVYAIPVSGYFPLAGCFFSGAANAAYSAMYGEIVRYTANEYRSKLFILFDSVFTLGASCGPLFGGLVTFSGSILGLKINDGNSPGIVLAAIWFVALCVLIFLPSDLGTSEIGLLDEISLSDGGGNHDDVMKSFNSSVLCLYYIDFSNSLLASTCSGIIPLLTMELFSLKLIHVKLLFAVGMMFVFFVCSVSYIATKHCSERVLLLCSIILPIPSMLMLCTYAILWTKVSFSMSYTLVIYICFGLPLPCYPFAGSLLSKITPSRHASTIQSGAVINFFVAALIGRGISGVVFTQTLLIAYSIVLALMWSVGAAWLAFVFRRLPP
ncbi:SPX domain-containing membrane protein At4g11810-like [Dendronephthya gigantea]|uniref:SPX domain-containing membrane protein At4g11810-like n=1 Tax=Dendronephthya gigantea TaxID=151771 RepID=UPI00106D7618|nr:SPX domain-containing membrane protein At4g11810-like [Dendronephthya gigantea]